MGFRVRDMLKEEIFGGAKLLGGEAGLDNEIQGATIIEAPDIVRFINGGEVLLTRFYAFQACTLEEIGDYFSEIAEKKISAIIIKRGNDVENIEGKVKFILNFAEEYSVPILEVAFELSFRELLKPILERLFDDEVRLLKYFKTTYDNFTALSFSCGAKEDGVQKILDTLEKLLGNPVALFNRNMEYLAGTEGSVQTLTVSEQTEEYHPRFYSNYTYLKQYVSLAETEPRKYEQYLVKWDMTYHREIYLAVTALRSSFGDMDDITIENAVTALRQELFRQHTVAELEEKFQNDIITQLLNGESRSKQELERAIRHLGIPLNVSYRVLIFKLWNESAEEFEKLNEEFNYDNVLKEAVLKEFEDVRVRNDVDKVIVIQQLKSGQDQKNYRRELRATAEKIQKRICQVGDGLRLKAGVGKEVEGIGNISESFREAVDSLEITSIFENEKTDNSPYIAFFSDMGIFKLLCKTDSIKELYEYIPESLQKLLHYKKAQGQELIQTLGTYLDRNQNLTKTAQDLFIHYKTAAYRIDRIAAITGIDFHNPNEVLAVRIGLIVYKIINNMEK